VFLFCEPCREKSFSRFPFPPNTPGYRTGFLAFTPAASRFFRNPRGVPGKRLPCPANTAGYRTHFVLYSTLRTHDFFLWNPRIFPIPPPPGYGKDAGDLDERSIQVSLQHNHPRPQKTAGVIAPSRLFPSTAAATAHLGDKQPEQSPKIGYFCTFTADHLTRGNTCAEKQRDALPHPHSLLSAFLASWRFIRIRSDSSNRRGLPASR